ncbi:hypothetical protein EON65_56975 [archaeon]|nr:MAG: hypothetical protein EON65_56975 [archaeon]
MLINPEQESFVRREVNRLHDQNTYERKEEQK